MIAAGEKHTAHNERLTLTVAANYGGRWDIAQAARRLIASEPDAVRDFAPEALEPYLSMAYAPEPDLFIRTGGEQRISNFLLWQLAYTELYFTDPDGLLIQLQDTKYCGGSGSLGEVCPG